MKLWKKATVLAAALLLAAGMAACSHNGQETSSSGLSETVPTVFPEGTSIGGKNISGKTVEEAVEICQAAVQEEVDALAITVKFKDDTVSLGKGDFTSQNVFDMTLPRLLETQEAGEYELSYVTDLSEAGMQKLKDAAKSCVAKGENATVSSFDFDTKTFTFTEEKNGSRVDMMATLKSVRQLLSQKHGGAIQAAFIETKPEITREYLADNFKQLSTYSTVSTNTANGNSNMALALSYVNGTVLQPGETFSYNACIGDSTDPNKGWLSAGGLVGGLMVQVYGGGICQGSTTLYNAALLAGMEIVARECHSTPSSYCPIGLDATVDYGNIDFQFKNPLENPVYISAWMDGVTLYVSFYGCLPEEWDRIEVGSQQTGSEPPKDTVNFKVDENLETGQYVRLSTGNTGYSAKAWRTFYKGEAQVKTEDLPSSTYPATGMTYSVGPDTDTEKVDTTKESGTTEPEATPTPAPTPAPTPEPPVIDTPTPEPSAVIEPTPGPDDIDSSGIVDWGD